MADDENKSLGRIFVEKTSEGLSKLLSKSWLVLTFYFIFKYIYLSIKELAGKVTVADIDVLWNVIIKAFSTEKPSWLLWLSVLILAILSILWALLERKSKKKHIETLSPFRKKYEELFDKHRTSSRLSKKGMPKD